MWELCFNHSLINQKPFRVPRLWNNPALKLSRYEVLFFKTFKGMRAELNKSAVVSSGLPIFKRTYGTHIVEHSAPILWQENGTEDRQIIDVLHKVNVLLLRFVPSMCWTCPWLTRLGFLERHGVLNSWDSGSLLLRSRCRGTTAVRLAGNVLAFDYLFFLRALWDNAPYETIFLWLHDCVRKPAYSPWKDCLVLSTSSSMG